MPHVSKRKIDEKALLALERQISSIIKCPNEKLRIRIFSELLTQTEKIMLAKHLAIVLLLKKGISLYRIAKILGISPSTAERYRVRFLRGKYKSTAEWLWKQTNEGQREELIRSLVRLMFTGKTKSFRQFVEEL